MPRLRVFVTIAVILCARQVMAQPLSANVSPSLLSSEAVTAQDARPCDGCPARRIGTAFLQVTFINVIYELVNLARGHETAHLTPDAWWTNMKRGWAWDLNDFPVNQIGHPYQGNNYFTTGRSNGLSFWESSALTAFGSGTWEYFGETSQASFNDFINTTLGGIALGEMFHRAAWMIRDTRATGRGRMWREIAATAIDPMSGYNRFTTGDASRVTEKPVDMVPSSRGVMTSAGVLGRGSNTSDVPSTADPFVEVDLLYGNLQSGESRTPYDAFGVRLAFGGGSAISEATVHGRLLGEPLRDGRMQLTVSQGYLYNNNEAYRFGAQSFDTNIGIVRQLNSRMSLWASAWGGLTILGAVDSVTPHVVAPLPGAAPEADEEEAPARTYDYGPGSNFGGFFNLRRDGREFIGASYEAHHLHVLDGVRANHFLQRSRVDLNIPLRGRLGVGVTGEFFDRRTYYKNPTLTDTHFHFPQFRLALTWSRL